MKVPSSSDNKQVVSTTSEKLKERGVETQPLLQLKGLKTHFFTDEGRVPAVDGITYKRKR
jgi:hypothetical protein